MSTSAVLTLGNTTTVLVLGEEFGVPISIIQGQTGPAWSMTIKNADNSAVNLTGVVFSGPTFFDQQAVAAGAGILGAGTFTVVSAAAGTVTYAPVAGDVAVPGEFWMELKFTISTLTYYCRTPITIAPRYAA